VFRRATLVLDSGRSVILDATFRSAGDRDRARALAAAQGARFLFIETICEQAELRRRLHDRAQSPAESDADERVLDRLLGTFVPPDELPPQERLAWNSGQPEDQLAAAVRAGIGAGAVETAG
jgi:predicted kinase